MSNLTYEQLEDVFASIPQPQETMNMRRMAMGAAGALTLVGAVYNLGSHDTQSVHAEVPVVTLAEGKVMGLNKLVNSLNSVNYYDRYSTKSSSSSSTSSTSIEVATTAPVETTPATDEVTTTTLSKMEAGVIGERPCGPMVDKAEVKRRFEAGEVVIKPSETADYLNNNPKMEAALNLHYTSLGNTDWIDYYIKTHPVLNDNIVKDHEDSGVRALKARMEAGQLPQDQDAQNFACSLNNDAVVKHDGPNGKFNHLQKGEQVWVLNFTKEDQDNMKKLGIELPASLLKYPGEHAGEIDIIMERLACNNPLLELTPPPTPPTTTSLETTTSTSTTIPETSTTSTSTTIPESTSSTSTSTTSTTIPATTTSTTVTPKGTEPPVICSVYAPCETTTTTGGQ